MFDIAPFDSPEHSKHFLPEISLTSKALLSVPKCFLTATLRWKYRDLGGLRDQCDNLLIVVYPLFYLSHSYQQSELMPVFCFQVQDFFLIPKANSVISAGIKKWKGKKSQIWKAAFKLRWYKFKDLQFQKLWVDIGVVITVNCTICSKQPLTPLSMFSLQHFSLQNPHICTSIYITSNFN